MKIFKRLSTGILSVYGYSFFAFVYVPIFLIVAYSFNKNPVIMMIWDGFTLDWYRVLFGLPSKIAESSIYLDSTDQLYNAVKNSLEIALSTTLISTIFSYNFV